MAFPSLPPGESPAPTVQRTLHRSATLGAVGNVPLSRPEAAGNDDSHRAPAVPQQAHLRDTPRTFWGREHVSR